MLLLVDIGNTRLKYALSDGVSILHSDAIIHNKDWPAVVSQMLTEIDNTTSHCLVASVMSAQDNRLIEETLSTCSRVTSNFLKTQKFQCGLENAYSNPDYMGVDRWLSMIGAWKKTQQATLVVSCGTALTIDLIDSKGQHQGGYIIPGIRMMQQLLNTHTAKVDADESIESDWQWGKNTQECVNAGSLLASISVIDQAIVNAENRYPQGIRVVLSGGDAPRIQTYLRHSVLYEPNLVFLGMLNVDAEAKGC